MLQKLRVLVIEETALGMTNIKSRLHELGYEAAALCYTPDAAEKAIVETDYDIALLDINFYSTQDPDYAATLTQFFMAVRKPFIFLLPAGFDEHHLLMHAAVAGALQKPIAVNELFTAVQLALNTIAEESQQPHFNNDNLLPADYFFIKRSGRLKKIYWENIHCIRKEDGGSVVSSAAFNLHLFFRTTAFYGMGYLFTALVETLLCSGKSRCIS